MSKRPCLPRSEYLAILSKTLLSAVLVGLLLCASPVFAQGEAGFPNAKQSQAHPQDRHVIVPEGAEESSVFESYEDGCLGDCYPNECYSNDCYPGGCCPCEFCFPLLNNRLWARAEYLLWWTKGSNLPPLVTTSPVGTSQNVAGVLGQSTTSVLFGGERVNTNAASGWRVSMGYWLDDCQNTGIEASYLGIGRETSRFSSTYFETPILARPYYDAQYSSQAAMLAAYPDIKEGSLSSTMSSQFQAIEVLLRRKMFQGNRDHMDCLIGWRYARLDESLRIDQSSQWIQTQGPIVAGTVQEYYDLFDAQNQFNGAQLGIAYREQTGRWSFEAMLKLGLGCTRSRMLIDGQTTTTVPGGGSSTITGDLLAQETNIGYYSKDSFSVMPELGVTVGYALTDRLYATFGYSFLYWSQVARPADQVDLTASQLPPESPTGALQPEFLFNMSDYWAQGLNFGLEYCF